MKWLVFCGTGGSEQWIVWLHHFGIFTDFMGYLKGKSTLMIYDRHPELQSKWDKAFWVRGYYVATIGNVIEAAIKKYIEEQSEESAAYSGCQYQRYNYLKWWLT